MSMYSVFFIPIIAICFSCSSPTDQAVSNSDTPDSIMPIDSLAVMVADWDEVDEVLGLGKEQFGDLDSMIERRTIRALVPYSHTFYFINGKERTGLSYDMLNAFEAGVNNQLHFHPPKVRVIFIPVAREYIIPLLQKGYGDIGAGGITVSEQRENLIDFSDPFITDLKQIVVGNINTEALEKLSDLSGKDVYVHHNTDYYNAIQAANALIVAKGLPPINIIFADPFLDSEDLLHLVHSGAIPYTVMTERIAKHWATENTNIKLYSAIVLRDSVALAWAFRKNSPKLEVQVNHFVRHHKKGSLEGNILYKKYIADNGQIENVNNAEAINRIRSTKAIFKKYASEFKLDWLLMIAQGYQESKLNPNARSHAGAVGIMQVKPSTAAGKEINIHDVNDVDNNIHASAKYTRYIIDRYFTNEEMTALNQELFALASYNAGPARVAGFRRRAIQEGLDPNIWFNNVELIAARHIGRETVQYVSNIYKYYCSFHYLEHYGELSGKDVIP